MEPSFDDLIRPEQEAAALCRADDIVNPLREFIFNTLANPTPPPPTPQPDPQPDPWALGTIYTVKPNAYWLTTPADGEVTTVKGSPSWLGNLLREGETVDIVSQSTLNPGNVNVRVLETDKPARLGQFFLIAKDCLIPTPPQVETKFSKFDPAEVESQEPDVELTAQVTRLFEEVNELYAGAAHMNGRIAQLTEELEKMKHREQAMAKTIATLVARVAATEHRATPKLDPDQAKRLWSAIEHELKRNDIPMVDQDATLVRYRAALSETAPQPDLTIVCIPTNAETNTNPEMDCG
jgi:hypothetical protein